MRLTAVAGLATLMASGAWVGAQESASAGKWKLAGSTGIAIGALAVDEWDGSGKTLLVAVGDEIRKTTDGGESWARLVEHPFVGLVPNEKVWAFPIEALASARSISVSPAVATHHVILAAPAAVDRADGAYLWRSTNGGASFEKVRVSTNHGRVFAVAFDPADQSGLRAYAFAGLSDGAFASRAAEPAGWTYASNDGGATWNNGSMIQAIRNTSGPAVAAVGSSASYVALPALSGAESSNKLLKVNFVAGGAPPLAGLVWKDAEIGVTRESAKTGLLFLELHSIRAMVADPQVAGTLYVAAKEGVLVSGDEGRTWNAAGTELGGTVTALAIHEGTRTLFAGTETGKVWALALPAAGADTAGTGTGTQPAANNPRPTLTSISPTNTQVGSTALTLTLTGTNFLSSSTVNFGSTTLSPGSITATSMTATVPNSAYAQAGVVAVTVANPGPGGGNSGGKEFKVQDFKFGPITPQTQTVIAGATATYKVQLLGLEGYNTEVTMTCSNGTPPAATCYFDPTDVTPSGIENVTITTTTNNAMVGPGRGPRRFGPPGTGAVRIYLVAAGFLGTGIYFLMGWRRRERIVSWSRGGVVVALWLVGGFVVSAGGCGGYKNSSANTGQGTTPGTYTITLSAAGVNSTTHNANIVLVVNNPQ